MQSLDLSGRVALVTGSTRGIGRAVADSIGKRGATVVVSARGAEDVAATVDAMTKDGLKALGRPCDVSRYDDVSALMTYVADETPGLDILVNNAGVGRFGHISELDPEQWDQVIGTNLNGVFFSKEYYELMRDRLNPGGLAIQWIPIHYPPAVFRIVVRTFSDSAT